MCVSVFVMRENDGQLDHEVLVAKLQEVNESQLKNVEPKLLQLLQDRSHAAINKLQRQALRTQQGAQGQKLKLKPAKRCYAFAPPETSHRRKFPTHPSQTLTLDSPRGREGDDGDGISAQDLQATGPASPKKTNTKELVDYSSLLGQDSANRLFAAQSPLTQ